jgi:hypothetical protein
MCKNIPIINTPVKSDTIKKIPFPVLKPTVDNQFWFPYIEFISPYGFPHVGLKLNPAHRPKRSLSLPHKAISCLSIQKSH